MSKVKLNKKEVSLFKKVIIPFFDNLIETGLIDEFGIRTMKNYVKNHEFHLFEIGPFTLTGEAIRYINHDSLKFEDYLDDKPSLKIDFPKFVYQYLAKECDVNARDLFISSMVRIADIYSVDIEIRHGVINIGGDIYISLMRDYSVPCGRFPTTEHVTVMSIGEDKFNMEVHKVFKFNDYEGLKDAIVGMTGVS